MAELELEIRDFEFLEFPEGICQKRGVDGPEEREKGNMAGRVHVEMGR